MLKRSPALHWSLHNYCLRPAVPNDCRQIRYLLRSYHVDAAKVGRHALRRRQAVKPVKKLFCLGLLLALLLQWLQAIGGLPLLLSGILALSLIAVAAWLNLRLADWHHYWVIELDDRLLACGQLRPHGSWALLSDVVVAPEWRRYGVGSQLISRLAELMPQPIYLACHPQLMPFYWRLGFRKILPQCLSIYAKQELGILDRPNLVVLRRIK